MLLDPLDSGDGQVDISAAAHGLRHIGLQLRPPLDQSVDELHVLLHALAR